MIIKSVLNIDQDKEEEKVAALHFILRQSYSAKMWAHKMSYQMRQMQRLNHYEDVVERHKKNKFHSESPAFAFPFECRVGTNVCVCALMFLRWFVLVALFCMLQHRVWKMVSEMHFDVPPCDNDQLNILTSKNGRIYSSRFLLFGAAVCSDCDFRRELLMKASRVEF
jgi:hypothetical protein